MAAVVNSALKKGKQEVTEREFHNKVIWMTFILGILVVMIHAYNIDLYIEPGAGGAFGAAVDAFESLISAAMPTVAVPGFFMVSAYLFCRGLSWKKVPGKMARRVGSVLVPYIAWNTLYYAGFSFVSRFPALWEVAGRKSVAFTLEGLADAIIHYTYNPVLWYLQQLIILIAIAPLIYAVMCRLWVGGAALVLMLAVIAGGVITPVLNLDALLYYSIGAYLSIHGSKLVEKKDTESPGAMWKKIVQAAAGFLLSACLYSGSIQYGSVLLVVLFGIVTPMVIWCALPSGLPEAKPYMKYSLFLYCLHFLPVRGINKAGALFLPHNAVTALIIYLALPVAVTAVTWLTAEFLKKRIPPLWKLLSGGR